MARAKTIGSLAMAAIISLATKPARESPKNTSAPLNAAANSTSFLCTAKSFLVSSRSWRPAWIRPLESNMKIFSSLTPSRLYSLAQDRAEAPAPETTILTFSIFLPANSRALMSAAALMIAVPCWSSCMIGISSSSLSLRSISKASGALISSRLMPPKVGAMALTVWIKSSGSLASTSMSKTSMSAKILNRRPLPSITGLEASGPISPSPSTAVPFEMTATRFCLAVYL